MIVLILLTLELVLQLLARSVNPYGSYAEFFELIKAEIKKSNSHNTIFFVGDSTIYGGGASDEKMYSLPAQFQDILRRTGSTLKVLNLGYPGTTGREHIEVLRLLPDKSKVIMRTGINDAWKRHESFKIRILGYYVEVRLLKLAMIMWHGWSRNADSESATSAYFKELQKHKIEKSFDLYFVDYFLGEETFMNTFFKDEANFIALAEILISNGFGDSENRISRRFLSYDLVHANDLGYRLQAQAVYNWFAEKAKWGLNPSQKLQLAVDQKVLEELHKTLESWLSKLKELQVDSVDFFPFAMKAAWQYYVATGDLKAKSIYDKLAKVYTYIFHSIYPITYTLNKLDRLSPAEIKGLEYSSDTLNQWFQIIRIFEFKSNHDYVSEYLQRFPEIMKVNKTYSSYAGLNAPHPLELCPRFVQETGFDISSISALDDWQFLFGNEFDLTNIAEKNWEICGRMSAN